METGAHCTQILRGVSIYDHDIFRYLSCKDFLNIIVGKFGILTTSEQTSYMKDPLDETRERPRKMAELLSGLKLNSASQAIAPAHTATTTGREFASPDSSQRTERGNSSPDSREELLPQESQSIQPGDIYTIAPSQNKPASTMMAATKHCNVATVESGQRVFHYNFSGAQNVTLNFN